MQVVVMEFLGRPVEYLERDDLLGGASFDAVAGRRAVLVAHDVNQSTMETSAIVQSHLHHRSHLLLFPLPNGMGTFFFQVVAIVDRRFVTSQFT